MKDRMKRSACFVLAMFLLLVLLPGGILAEGELTITLTPDRTEAGVGDTVTWTAAVSGGTGTYSYCFYLFLNGKVEERGEYGAEDHCSFTLASPGEYTVRVYVKAGSGEAEQFTGGAVTVAAGAGAITLTPDRTEAQAGDTVTWTAAVSGKTEGLSYCFYLFLNGKVEERGEYGAEDHCSFTLSSPGEYTVRVYVKGDSGQTQDYTGGAVSVAPPALEIRLTANQETVKTGKAVTWTAEVPAGEGEAYSYCFYILRDGEAAERGEYGPKNTFTYTPKAPGTYTARVYVKRGEEAAQQAEGAEVSVTGKTAKEGKTSAEKRVSFLWVLALAGLVVLGVLDVLFLLSRLRMRG